MKLSHNVTNNTKTHTQKNITTKLHKDYKLTVRCMRKKRNSATVVNVLFIRYENQLFIILILFFLRLLKVAGNLLQPISSKHSRLL
jgi:hypothetical protein